MTPAARLFRGKQPNFPDHEDASTPLWPAKAFVGWWKPEKEDWRVAVEADTREECWTALLAFMEANRGSGNSEGYVTTNGRQP